MTRRTEIRSWRTRVVDIARYHVEQFRTKYVPEYNIVEKVARDLTGGDPTLQRFRDQLFRKPALLLIHLNVSPNKISFIGALFAFIAAVFANNPLLFALFLTLNLACDGIDGVVARLQNTDSDYGSIVDIFSDTFSLLIVSVGLVASGSLSFAICIPYAALVVVYTYRSALKSKSLNDSFLSVGSRILTFLGIISISISSWIDLERYQGEYSYNIFFGLISLILGITYLVDSKRSKKRI